MGGSSSKFFVETVENNIAQGVLKALQKKGLSQLEPKNIAGNIYGDLTYSNENTRELLELITPLIKRAAESVLADMTSYSDNGNKVRNKYVACFIANEIMKKLLADVNPTIEHSGYKIIRYHDRIKLPAYDSQTLKELSKSWSHNIDHSEDSNVFRRKILEAKLATMVVKHVKEMDIPAALKKSIKEINTLLKEDYKVLTQGLGIL